MLEPEPHSPPFTLLRLHIRRAVHAATAVHRQQRRGPAVQDIRHSRSAGREGLARELGDPLGLVRQQRAAAAGPGRRELALARARPRRPGP